MLRVTGRSSAGPDVGTQWSGLSAIGFTVGRESTSWAQCRSREDWRGMQWSDVRPGDTVAHIVLYGLPRCVWTVSECLVCPFDERLPSAWSRSLSANSCQLSAPCYPFGSVSEQRVSLSGCCCSGFRVDDTPGQQILSVYKVAPKLSENRFCRSGLFRCFQNALFPFLTVLQVIGINWFGMRRRRRTSR